MRWVGEGGGEGEGEGEGGRARMVKCMCVSVCVAYKHTHEGMWYIRDVCVCAAYSKAYIIIQYVMWCDSACMPFVNVCISDECVCACTVYMCTHSVH